VRGPDPGCRQGSAAAAYRVPTAVCSSTAVGTRSERGLRPTPSRPQEVGHCKPSVRKAEALPAPRRGLPGGAGLLVVLLALWASTARAEVRFMGVADVRGVYNSNVVELEATSIDPSQRSGDIITEVEPGLRLYWGLARGLFTLRYSFEGQYFAQTKDPETGGPLLGYGNNLHLGYAYLISPRVELAFSNLFRQGTENITQQSTLGASGAVNPLAPRLAVGSRYFTNVTGAGVSYLINQAWSVRPQAHFDTYYPYSIPTTEPTTPGEVSQPGPNPVYSVTLGNLLTRSFATSVLLFNLEGSFHADQLDREHRKALGVQDRYLDTFPEFWTTLIVGASAAWRWQITDFLDTHLGGGFSLASIDRVDTTNQVLLQELTPAPLAEAVIRYRRGRNLLASFGYSHGWTRQPELGQSSVAQTDALTLYGFYGLQDWTFEAIGSYLYLSMTTHAGSQGDSNMVATGELVASYLLMPGFSIEASYRYDTLFNRILGEGVASTVRVPPTVERHVATLGISVAWPAPPVQEVRLTRRESQYEPLFSIGQGTTAVAARERERNQMLRPQEQIRRTPAPWERGTTPTGPPSLLPPPEEEPPMPDRSEEDDSGYYSWPR